MSRAQVPWVQWLSTTTLGVPRRHRVHVHPPDAAFRAAWDAEVQPEIDRVGFGAHAQREAFRRMRFLSTAGLEETPVREDTGWRWSAEDPAGELARAEALARAAGLRPALFALSLVHPQTRRLVPAAMLLLCEAFLPAPQVLAGPAVLLWHLSLAPDAISTALLGGPIPPAAVAPLALDVALCRAFHLGYQGRLLHLGRAGGGSPLLDVPGHHGLTPVGDEVEWLAPGWPNHGQCFVADEAAAARLSAALDPLRALLDAGAGEVRDAAAS